MNSEALTKTLTSEWSTPPVHSVWKLKPQVNWLPTEASCRQRVDCNLAFSATDHSSGATMEAGATSHNLELRGSDAVVSLCPWQNWDTILLEHVTLKCNRGFTESGDRKYQGCMQNIFRRDIMQKACKQKERMEWNWKKTRRRTQNTRNMCSLARMKKAGPERDRGNNKCCSSPSLGWVRCWVTVRAQIQMMSHFLKHTGTRLHTQL